MTATPDISITEAVRRIAEHVGDERQARRVLDFATALERELEAGRKETLAENVSTGSEVLDLFRIIDGLIQRIMQLEAQMPWVQQELKAKSELIIKLDEELSAVKADCGKLTTAMAELRSLEQRFKNGMEKARGNMNQVVSQTRGGQQDLNKRFHDVNTQLQRLETIGLEVVEYRGYLEGLIEALGERLSRPERGGEAEA